METEIQKYYNSFFSSLPLNLLVEVYDIVDEKFITFPGNDGSPVMNKNSLIKNLVEMELVNKVKVESLIVLPYNREDVIFNQPVFIGRRDCFKGKIRKNDVEYS